MVYAGGSLHRRSENFLETGLSSRGPGRMHIAGYRDLHASRIFYINDL